MAPRARLVLAPISVATLLAATSEAMAINYVTGEFLFAFSGG